MLTNHLKRLKLSTSGMTIAELVVSMSLTAIVMASATTNFGGMVQNMQKNQTISTFTNDLGRARAAAMSHGARAILQIAPDKRSYTIGLDYRPFNTSTAAVEQMVTSKKLPAGITLVLENNPIIFSGNGWQIDLAGAIKTTRAAFYQHGDHQISGTITASGSVFPTTWEPAP